MKLVILKLGGSVIAPKKATRPFLRKKLLSEIAEALKKSFNGKGTQLIIIHGGGSFCHPLAKKYSLSKGTLGEKEREDAAEKTASICRMLSRRVGSILSEKLPISLIDTSSIAKNADGRLLNMDVSPINRILENSQIPLLSGHVVRDETLGKSLVSGDRIAATLAKKLGADAIFFASDVDGVFDTDPHANKQAKHIKKISLHDLEKRSVLTHAAHTDATGGMLEKFSPFFESGMHVDRIHVFDGRKIEALSQIGKDPFPFGTVITKK